MYAVIYYSKTALDAAFDPDFKWPTVAFLDWDLKLK